MADFSENIDLNTIFTEAEGNFMTFSVTGNTNPAAVTTSINANTLTIEGTAGEIAETTITVQAVSGENTASDQFVVSSYDPRTFTYLEQGFESIFPPPFWEIKYNTAADGGLNGANLSDPLADQETWFQNTPSTPSYGSDYIRTGNNSALIKYWAPEFNWLISPPMQLDYNDYELKFWVWYSTSSYETKFHVLVDDGAKGWTSTLNWDASSPDNAYGSEVSLSLADFVGKTVKIAFVYEYSDGFELALDDIRMVSPSRIENSTNMADDIYLMQNYPNPFNPSTSINFSIPDNSEVSLSVFNHKGELVKELFRGKLEKGFHDIDFNGSEMSSGVYYYKLESDKSVITKKMVLIK